eukprot:2520888-Pleurochrysis_carterae.AAC.1
MRKLPAPAAPASAVRAAQALRLFRRPCSQRRPRRRRRRAHAATTGARGPSRRCPLHGSHPRHARRPSPAPSHRNGVR